MNGLTPTEELKITLIAILLTGASVSTIILILEYFFA